ncbi:MAG: oligopeptide ABC transporter substrate-binding protein [Lactobacillaceae bacterium]|jgi:peptide/nickel transport system substrate-binding protein|nr:oligopeptide ABC transporter substrate-binding protein [Lactobacillaceae bacterium]
MKKNTIKFLSGSAALGTLAGTFLSAAPLADAAKVGKFDTAYKNPKKAIKGGTLKVAEVSETPFVGQWLGSLSDDATTSNVTAYANEGLFWTDSSFKFIKGGLANLKIDKEAKTATITLRDDAKWSDGQPIVAKDIEYNYEITGNPKSGSSRFTDALANIKGYADYHDGKADTISGVELPDGDNGKKVVLHFDQVTPGMYQSGNGYFLEEAVPYHQLKDIKFEDLAKAKETNTEPVTTGVFRVKKIVPGESISYERNPYYFGKKPKLDGVTVSILAPSKAVASAKSGEYDIYLDAGNSNYPKFSKVSGYKIVGQLDNYFSALYYNLGHFDAEKGINVTDRETPLNDVKVRQALGYARNVTQVQKKFSNGLASLANTTIPPLFEKFANKDVKAYDYQPKKAAKLLDEAGWKLNKKTGIREKDGKKLSFVYLGRSGSANSETVAQNYIQKWKAVGVEVKLYKNKLIDFNTYVSMMTDPTADQNWDFTDGAWSLSSEPSQSDLFGARAPYNFGHFTSDKLTSLLKNIDSEKSLDESYRIKQFHKYQQYVHDEAFIIPTSFNISYVPVNKRVTGYNLDFGQNEKLSNIGVSSKKTVTK